MKDNQESKSPAGYCQRPEQRKERREKKARAGWETRAGLLHFCSTLAAVVMQQLRADRPPSLNATGGI